MFLFPISFTSLQLDKKRVERGSSRARHIPQMLQCSFRFTRHRRCTYYRQCGSCTLCSQVWDVQMTIVFVSVHIRFFFRSHSFTVSPGHFFYIHDVKYTIKIVTKDNIFSGNGKKKYYTIFFIVFFPSSSYSDVDCVSALRKCVIEWWKTSPLYSVPTHHRWRMVYPNRVACPSIDHKWEPIRMRA